VTYPRKLSGAGPVPTLCHECGEECDGTLHYVDELIDVDRTRLVPCPVCSWQSSDGDTWARARWECCLVCGDEIDAAHAWEHEPREYVCSDTCGRDARPHERERT
jgi:hypothetical protein